MMLKALLKPSGEKPPEYIPVTTDDEVDLGGRTLRFLHTPYLHWPDTQCTYLVEDGLLFTGDIFGCHFCDKRLFNEAKCEKTLVVFYISAYGNTRRMAEALATGAESIAGVRVSLYDLEGGESGIFTDLIEEADGLAFGSPTINADAVKPVWDVLSSLTTVNVKGKLVPDTGELEQCHLLGEQLAHHLTGQVEHREIDFSQLQASTA
jgi:flavorubredoxin